MIFFKTSDEQIQPIIDEVNSIIDLYASDPIIFGYVDIAQMADFVSQFGDSPAAVMYRPSNNKYSVYTGDGFGAEKVRSFVDNVISGNGRFKRIQSQTSDL